MWQAFICTSASPTNHKFELAEWWGKAYFLLQSFSVSVQEAKSMSVKENVELMRRWFKEVWNEGKTQTIHDILAPDGVGIGELEDGSPLRGPGEFVPFVERVRGAFPDINIVVEDAFGAKDRSALVGHDDTSRRSSGNASHRQASANNGDYYRSH
jgi:hypothetical protein